MMEALVMLLRAEMPVDAMADLLDEPDTRLWRVLMHCVEQAHAKNDWSAVQRIAVDETSARRGRRYVFLPESFVDKNLRKFSRLPA